MHEILLVDKPAGWTSFDIVNYTRKLVAKAENKQTKQVKVGHAGTLDPFATGLLIVLIGDYTKQSNKFMKLDKSYEFTIKLGYSSTTGDPEGEIKHVSAEKPTIEEIQQVLHSFKGEIELLPPVYSAIKIKGKKSYQLAREGKEIKHKPRQVRIEALELASYSYPLLKLKADVSSGTYIRSMSEEIGRSLGVSAYTTKLRRLSVGQFKIEQAVTVKELASKIKSLT